MKQKETEMPMDSEMDETMETPEQEKGDYSHIDEFINSLDSDEMSYLKGCLSKHKKGDSGKLESVSKSKVEDKEYSAEDFEKD